MRSARMIDRESPESIRRRIEDSTESLFLRLGDLGPAARRQVWVNPFGTACFDDGKSAITARAENVGCYTRMTTLAQLRDDVFHAYWLAYGTEIA